jgi:hypothetical protein
VDRHVLVSLSGAYSINPAHVTPSAAHLLGGVDPLLTFDQAAAALGVTVPTFYNKYRHRLPAVAIDGKSKRVRLSEVARVAAEVEAGVDA